MMHDPETRTQSGRHHGRVVTICGRREIIDEHIAPLIRLLNDMCMYTTNSCQASCGGACSRKHKRDASGVYKQPKRCAKNVWIVFETVDDAQRFMNIVHNFTDEQELRDCVLGFGTRDSDKWTWRVTSDDRGDEVVFRCHLVFPRKHLQMVMQRLLTTNPVCYKWVDVCWEDKCWG